MKDIENINWKEIEDKLNNDTFTNEECITLLNNTLEKMKTTFHSLRSILIEKYPDKNNRPKDIQNSIDKIDKLLNNMLLFI